MGKSNKSNEDLEHLEGIEQTLEVFENDIVLYLKMFCEENNLQDLKKESQSVWNAALMYIKRNVFNDRSKLKDKTNINISNNTISSNFNRYNYSLVNDICDYYIYLCLMYDKEVSLTGFSNLTGISLESLNEWGNNVNILSNLSSEIYKKLNHFREESLSNKLATAKSNPVGILAILNRHYQWNLPGVSREKAQPQVISVNELQQLEDIKKLGNADK
jgi:hypothetical protein